jgi:hypothetical protein
VSASNRRIVQVRFTINGANLNLDDKDNVETVSDAKFVLEADLGARAAGHPGPALIERGAARLRASTFQRPTAMKMRSAPHAVSVRTRDFPWGFAIDKRDHRTRF